VLGGDGGAESRDHRTEAVRALAGPGIAGPAEGRASRWLRPVAGSGRTMALPSWSRVSSWNTKEGIPSGVTVRTPRMPGGREKALRIALAGCRAVAIGMDGRPVNRRAAE